MKFSQENFQKTKRISDAIQQFLLQTGLKNARSTDVYDVLARKGLIEKDRHRGLHFRNFLRQLKDANLLHLIPQCSSNPGTRGNKWYVPLPAMILLARSLLAPLQADIITACFFTACFNKSCNSLLETSSPLISIPVSSA
jgi:hypothetical protein